MQAVWYETQGPAAEVLQYGEIDTPEPGPGEVRVRPHRQFGTAAQFTVVPDALAVALFDSVADPLAACFGIPGITADGALTIPIAEPLALRHAAEAHDRVDAGARDGRVLLEVPE